MVNKRKIYKTYFNKNDTTSKTRTQQKKKYSTMWLRKKYKKFFEHEVVKIKLFGLITIYNKEKEK